MGKSGFTLMTTACGTMQRMVRDLPHLSMKCLGFTKGGQPRHPLMLSYKTMAEDYF